MADNLGTIEFTVWDLLKEKIIAYAFGIATGALVGFIAGVAV